MRTPARQTLTLPPKIAALFLSPQRSVAWIGLPPRLFVHEHGARLIECLPSLQHNPNRPESVLKVDADEDGVGGDDTADCLRYLVATKERKVTQRKLRGL